MSGNASREWRRFVTTEAYVIGCRNDKIHHTLANIDFNRPKSLDIIRAKKIESANSNGNRHPFLPFCILIVGQEGPRRQPHASTTHREARAEHLRR